MDGSGPIHSGVTQVPAVGFSLTTNLDGNRQAVFQGFVPADMSDGEVNAFLDRVRGFSDRLRAVYEIGEVEAELRKHRDSLAQMTEDRARLDLEHEEAQALRRQELAAAEAGKDEARSSAQATIGAEILKMQELRQTKFNEGLNEYRRQGRQGSYSPQGARKADLEKIDRGIELAKIEMDEAVESAMAQYEAQLETRREAIQKADAEREQAHAHMAISVKRYTEAIAEREERLGQLKALIGG